MKTGAPIQAVARTLDTLEILADTPSGVTVVQLSERLEVDKSIASRLLSSLLDRGYAEREPGTERYRLSLRLLGVAARYADRIGFPATCQPLLEALSGQTRELVQLSLVDGDALVLSAYAQARQQLAIMPALGRNVALHATASGKAWLASLPGDQGLEIALRHGLTPRTERTITEVAALVAEFERVREAGYALAEGEFTNQVNSIAFPIGAERLGVVVAALAVSAPASRMDRERLTELAPTVREAAAGLEAIWPVGAVRAEALRREDLTSTP